MRNVETGLCLMLVSAFALLGASRVNGQSKSISVTNWSFETVGTSLGGGWYQLPAAGAWGDGNGNTYEILDLSAEAGHFPSYNSGPGGTRVLNLPATTPMTQNLGYAVSAGDRIAVSFAIGDSATQLAGSIKVAILVGGVTNDSAIVTNTAPSGWFVQAQTLLTTTNSGNLSILFANVSGDNWLDMIDVCVVPPKQIPVGNFSFETKGTVQDAGAGWWHLADLGSWQKAATNGYQIHDAKLSTAHFNSVPEGINVLNLANAGQITQNLGYTVSGGSRVTIDYHLGDSKATGQNPGNIEVSILVDGVTNGSATVANTATDGVFVSKQSQLTTTSRGNLSIRFTNTSNQNWLDNVNVTVQETQGTFIYFQ